MVRKTLALMVFILLLGGCSRCVIIRSEYYDITGKVLSAKAVNQEIQIYTQKPDKPYEEIGAVKVLAQLGTTQEAMNEELKRRAKAAGADAIVDVQYGEDISNEVRLCGKVLATKRNMTAIGKAVIFKDKN